MNDRANFAASQVGMSSTWLENLKKRNLNVEEYIAGRNAAYLMRWQEALKYVKRGSKLLDIGGGNVSPDIFRLISNSEIDYFYLDIDEGVMNNTAIIASEFGFPRVNFQTGFNDSLPFERESFDVIFSSHCIEHSFDLEATLKELNRVLRLNGSLIIAVPFGWEENPNHPYFLSPENWQNLIEDSGFEIMTSTISNLYPEEGYDLFIAARKKGDFKHELRINPFEYRKDHYHFLEIISPAVKVFQFSNSDLFADSLHLKSKSWIVEINLRNATSILPIATRHQYSGIIKTEYAGSQTTVDLYSQYHYLQPFIIKKEITADSKIIITNVGKNPCALGNELNLVGLYYK